MHRKLLGRGLKCGTFFPYSGFIKSEKCKDVMSQTEPSADCELAIMLIYTSLVIKNRSLHKATSPSYLRSFSKS